MVTSTRQVSSTYVTGLETQAQGLGTGLRLWWRCVRGNVCARVNVCAWECGCAWERVCVGTWVCVRVCCELAHPVL